jgi:hypothetical protein
MSAVSRSHSRRCRKDHVPPSLNQLNAGLPINHDRSRLRCHLEPHTDRNKLQRS